MYSQGPRGRVETHCGRSGQIEALGPAVDGHRDGFVRQRDELGWQSPCLVPEHPGGRPGQPGLDLGIVQGASGAAICRDDPQACLTQGDDSLLEPGPGHHWLPADARTHLPL